MTNTLTPLRSELKYIAISLVAGLAFILLLDVSGVEGPEKGDLRPTPETPGQIEQTINFIVAGWPWSVAIPIAAVAVVLLTVAVLRCHRSN